MKWKEMTITIFACVLLIAAGTSGVSFLYQIMFHPKTILEEYSAHLNEWQEEQAQYEKELLYPFSFSIESGSIVETEGSYLLSDLYQMKRTVYSSVLGLAGLQWMDLEDATVTTYEYRTDTIEYEEYGLRHLFHIVLMPDDRNDNMIIAVDKNSMPILVQYGSANTFGDIGNDISMSHSSLVSDAFLAKLQEYLAQIDKALIEQSSYWQLIRNIEKGIPMPSDEELPSGSLERYSKYGEWQIYADAKTTAYVCIINDYNFILYYDMGSGKFCGYNLALNGFG